MLGDPEIDVTQVVVQSIELGSIPAVVMLFGSLGSLLTPPPKGYAHALQHLAAGIMLCAIAVELVPVLVNAEGPENMGGMIAGFTLGVAVMLGMSVFLEGEEDEGDEAGTPALDGSFDEEGGRGGEMARLLPSGLGGEGGESLDATPAGRGGRPPLSDSRAGSVCSESSNTSSGARLRQHGLVGGAYRIAADRAKAQESFHGGEMDETLPPPRFPSVFAMAVYIDSFLDGLLIGLTLITGKSAGMYMAVALTVEMGFLGLTFAAACAGQPRIKAVAAVVAGPVFLVLGSGIGGLVANALSVNEPALVGCTAFGVAALLYMVAEELLVSAHEEGEEHVWWIDLQVFVGFLLALIVAKAFG